MVVCVVKGMGDAVMSMNGVGKIESYLMGHQGAFLCLVRPVIQQGSNLINASRSVSTRQDAFCEF